MPVRVPSRNALGGCSRSSGSRCLRTSAGSAGVGAFKTAMRSLGLITTNRDGAAAAQPQRRGGGKSRRLPARCRAASVTGAAPHFAISGLRRRLPRRGAGTSRRCRTSTFPSSSGETVALVGELGSGKSVTSLSIIGLLPRLRRQDRGGVESHCGARDGSIAEFDQARRGEPAPDPRRPHRHDLPGADVGSIRSSRWVTRSPSRLIYRRRSSGRPRRTPSILARSASRSRAEPGTIRTNCPVACASG